jgi:competence protein ComEC
MASILPAVASILISLTLPFANWIVWLCHTGAQFPVLQFSSVAFFILIMTAILILTIKRNKKILLIVMVLILSQLTYSRFAWPGTDWQVTNCDVGQGDGLAINLGQHRTILIDTGPDPQLIDRCLSSLKITKISLLVLTHFHADHVGGLIGAIHKREVNQVWISNNHQPESAYKSTKAILKTNNY